MSDDNEEANQVSGKNLDKNSQWGWNKEIKKDNKIEYQSSDVR